MQQTFEFIDLAKNDRATRRRARSHAMRGKNVGKKIQRHSRLSANQKSKAVCQTAVRPDILETNGRSANYKDSIHRSALGDMLLTVPYPIEVASRNKRIINDFFGLVADAIYLPTLCHSIEKTKAYWFQLLFEDRTAYHCTIALLATWNAFFLGSAAIPVDAGMHLDRAIQLVNHKLDGPQALSDSSLSVVNFLIVQGLLQEVHSVVETHSKGLQQMIELRGGLSQLEENKLLLLKICKTDIDRALHYGTRTRFYRDKMFEVERHIQMENARLPQRDRIHTKLAAILDDLTKVAHLFNSSGPDFRMDPGIFQELIISIGYRLVKFRPLNEPQPSSWIDAAYHIGLTTFVSTLYLQMGPRRALKYRLVGKCLRDIIDRATPAEDSDIILWLLLLGSISVSSDLNRNWFAARLQECSRVLAIDGWTTLHEHLSRFPWIQSLHSEPAKVLWSSVQHDLHIDEP